MTAETTHALKMFYDGDVGTYYARISPPLASEQWLTGFVALHPNMGRRGIADIPDTAYEQSCVRNPDGEPATEYIAMDIMWSDEGEISSTLSKALQKCGVELDIDQEVYLFTEIESTV